MGLPRIKPLALYYGAGLFSTKMRSLAQLDFVPAREGKVGASTQRYKLSMETSFTSKAKGAGANL